MRWLGVVAFVLLAAWGGGSEARETTTDPLACVKTYLSAANFIVAGTPASDTRAIASAFASIYTSLGLPPLSETTASTWCSVLDAQPAQAVLAQRALPSTPPPKGTFTVKRGLSWSSPLALENYAGYSDLVLFSIASTWPGRVVVETDPTKVRSGQSSIRMHLLPGDCGAGTPWTTSTWNDCEHGNERVSTDAGAHGPGERYYGLSIMLGDDTLALPGPPNPWNKAEINLFQWFQLDSNGACFNLQFNTRGKFLDIDVRCPHGVYDDSYLKVVLPDARPNVWQEFVVHANWSIRQTGFFRVLQNGRMVFDFEGPTLVDAGHPQIEPHPQIYAYGEGGDTPVFAGRLWQTPATVWFDDMVVSQSLKTIRAKYTFDPAELENFAAALPVQDFRPSN